MNRIWLASVALISLSISSVHAAAPYFYPGYGMGPQARPSTAPTQPAPDQIVRQGIDRLKGFLSRGSASPAQIRAFLDEQISPYFDFAYMAKWAGGEAYRNMNEQQRRRFAMKLKGMFFSALARNLDTYSSTEPRIKISRPRRRPGSNEVNVATQVSPVRGYPTKLIFRFYRSRDGWKVFDVTANGTSAVAYYRKHFRDLARRGQMPMGR